MPNKEQSQKNSSKSYCGKCGKELSPIKMCRCAGGGGSGSSSEGRSGGDSETKGKDNVNLFSQITGASSQVVGTSTQMPGASAWVQSQLCSDRAINYEARLLSVEGDRLRGNLIFRLNTGLTKAEIEIAHKFLNTVKAEFDKFKDQLKTEQGVLTKDLLLL